MIKKQKKFLLMSLIKKESTALAKILNVYNYTVNALNHIKNAIQPVSVMNVIIIKIINRT